jgi:biopolymer transport protein ExbD
MRLHLVPDEEDDAIDFTPMIAVVFLLVFFLMLISSFFEEAPGYRLSLPVAESSQLISQGDAEGITLTANDEIWYRDAGGETMLNSLAELEERLKRRAEPGRPVILRCDRLCTFEQVTLLKNAVINAGVPTIFEEMGARP